MDNFFSDPDYFHHYSTATQELKELDDTALDRNWNLLKYFGHIKLISLDTQSERFKRCQKELASIGLKPDEYEIIPGVDGNALPKSEWERMQDWEPDISTCSSEILKKRKIGRMGCFLAHYQTIKETVEKYHQAKMNLDKLSSDLDTLPEELKTATQNVRKYSSVLIMEDNIGFGRVTGPQSADLTGCGRQFRLAMQELPSHWDMFYFLSMKFTLNTITLISPHVAQLSYGLIMKGYAINASMYEWIIKILESYLQGDGPIYPIDNTVAELHTFTNCYVSTPPLCYRFPSPSLVYVQESDIDSEDLRNKQSDVV